MTEKKIDRRTNEEAISAVLKSLRPIKEFDEGTGYFVPFMKMNCYFCKNEQSMIILLDNKGNLCSRAVEAGDPCLHRLR